jgi:hypothetical protein
VSGLILQLSFLQSPVFLINSRLGHFTAATRRWHPLSRSYRVNLPSSLTTNHSRALGYSPRLPVSVYGTGFSVEAFLGRSVDALSTCSKAHSTIRGSRLPSTNNSVCSQHLAISVLSTWYRNINLLSIGYPKSVRLRSRLTLIRLALIRKP